MEKIDFIFFIHTKIGQKIMIVRDVKLEYIKGVEERAKECDCKEMITWVAFSKDKKIVKSGIINKPKDE